jgi:hypothetical protein
LPSEERTHSIARSGTYPVSASAADTCVRVRIRDSSVVVTLLHGAPKVVGVDAAARADG